MSEFKLLCAVLRRHPKKKAREQPHIIDLKIMKSWLGRRGGEGQGHLAFDTKCNVVHFLDRLLYFRVSASAFTAGRSHNCNKMRLVSQRSVLLRTSAESSRAKSSRCFLECGPSNLGILTLIVRVRHSVIRREPRMGKSFRA